MNDLRLGDCLEVLRTLPENSIDSLVTDPPYGIRFMGKAWDGADIVRLAERDKPKEPVLKKDGRIRQPRADLAAEAGKYSRTHEDMKAFQKWTEIWAREVYRVLKPGAHALVFCSPRSYHRMASGLEDAGFEIRDQIQWLFGSGFPKSMNVSIAIDKQKGLMGARGKAFVTAGMGSREDIQETSGWEKDPGHEGISDEAKQWQGWGTALKPANEPICLARKPLSESTVAKNILKWSTGGINVDGCRVAPTKDYGRSAANAKGIINAHDGFDGKAFKIHERDGDYASSLGRFPANLILSHSPHCTEEACDMFDCPVKGLDEQSGESKGVKRNYKYENKGGWKQTSKNKIMNDFGDSGGASRFFYCAKVSSRERNQGCDVVRVDPWESADLGLLTANVEQLVKGISDTLVLFMASQSWSTDLYGHSISEQYPMGLMFTISTVIKLITELKTLRSSQNSNTKDYIQDALKTIEANGLNLAESVEFLNRLDRTTIRDQTAAVLNASNALLNELLKINKIAKESEDGVGTKNVHPT